MSRLTQCACFRGVLQWFQDDSSQALIHREISAPGEGGTSTNATGSVVGEGDGIWPLHCAVRQEDDTLVEKLLLAGADANGVDDVSGEAPLQLAVEAGNLTIVDLLLHYGADPLSKNTSKLNPLQLAASHNYHDIYSALLSTTALIHAQQSNLP